jgi:hypothetical protein
VGEVRVPRLESVNGRIIKRSEPLSKSTGSAAEGKLHDDGAVFDPCDWGTVIKFTDVAEGRRDDDNKDGCYQKTLNFHVGDLLKEREIY